MIVTKRSKMKTELEIANRGSGVFRNDSDDEMCSLGGMENKLLNDKIRIVLETAELNSSREVFKWRLAKSVNKPYSNLAVHSPPQSLKSGFQQCFPTKLIEGDIIGDSSKPYIFIHISCASDIAIKEQMSQHLQGLNGSHSFTKELAKKGFNILQFVFHRNDLDFLDKSSPQYCEKGKSFIPVPFKDPDKEWTHLDKEGNRALRSTPVNLRKIIEGSLAGKFNLILSFDEVHQHIVEDGAIHALHKELRLDFNKYIPNIFCLYVTATGSGLHKYLEGHPNQTRQTVLKRPIEYCGFDFYLNNNLVHDLQDLIDFKISSGTKVPVWKRDAATFYSAIFEYIEKDAEENLKDREKPYAIAVRIDGGRGKYWKKQEAEVEKRAKLCAERINADIVYVDSSRGSTSFDEMNKWLKSPPVHEEDPFGDLDDRSTKNRIYITKRMVGCGQTVCTDNLRFVVEPPMSHEALSFTTYIQRVARVLGLNKSTFTQLLAWKAPILRYQDICEAIDMGDWGPMASLPNELVKAVKEKDWGWTCAVIDKNDPDLTLRSNAIILKLSTLAKHKGDLSIAIEKAIKEKDHYVNPINKNKVGGSPNAHYAKAIVPTANAYVLEIDGKHPGDVHDTWGSYLKQYQNKYVIVYRARKEQLIEKLPEATKRAFFGKIIKAA
jgi:hypothetical protein